uniref:Death domain-containing protein n=1 Tax=Amphimedon queenslandica TaxID=400682 RepID=A0A1X7TS97_AMPQE
MTRWHELGLRLGLHKDTLNVLEAVFPDDKSHCLTECLSKWLRRADNVDNKGGATFDSLSDDLKSMNENAAADMLDQEKHNAMISGNDIKRTNDVHSTATGPALPPGTNKPLIGGPPLSPIALMDIPDDRPTVSELIEFHELLIKGQLEESLPLLDADTIRKIRNAASADEGLSLLIKAFEEHPTLLHEMRVATGKVKVLSQKTLKNLPLGPTQLTPPVPKLRQKSLPTCTQCAQSPPVQNTQPPPVPPRRHKKPSTTETPPTPKSRSKTGPSSQPQVLVAIPAALPSPEYITMREMLADLVDLLAGNAPVILQLNNRFFSLAIIPQDVHNAVAHLSPTPNERATQLINSLLTIIQTNSNPNSVFSSLITSLQKVGLRNMASKLMENLKMKGGHVDPNLEQQPSVSKGPLQPVDVAAQSHTPQPTITGSQSSTPTTVIELSSKSEVAANIESLLSRFASLDSNIRHEFEDLVKKGKVKLKAVARNAAAYLSIKVSSLKYGKVDKLFDSLQPHYDFFSCGVLKHLTNTYLSKVQTELTQYIDSVDDFSESSQLKHIRSTIKEKLPSLPAAASPTTSDQTKPVVIKLNGRWDEMTLTKFKRVLQYYFGHKVTDISTIVDIVFGSVVITLLIPTSLSQSLIDAINNKTNSMSRLGILEVAVDNKPISIRRKGDNNFDISLHQSVKAGNSFEVSMLLQLGADPNSKDERGKSAVEIANEGGYTQIKEIILTGGGGETGKVEWGSDKVTLTKPSAGQCQEVISQLTDSHRNIYLDHSSPDIVYLLMSLALDIRTIKKIHINYTKITKDVILSLSHKITNNISLEALWISPDSINDDGVIALTQSLINNKTITSLFLPDNPDITSISAQSLAKLLLNNHTISILWLNGTNIDTDGVLVLMETLRTNNTLRTLALDNKHKQTCYLLPYYKAIENRLDFWSCGPIDGIRIIKDTRTGINKGFAYVKLKDSSSVLFACKKNERIELEGRKLRVFCCFSDKSKFQTKFGGANEHDCRQLVKDLRKQLVEVKREKEQITVKVQCSQRQQQNKESDLYNERERLKQELA